MKSRLILAAAMAVAASATAIPALTSAQPSGRTITVHEKVTGLKFVHHDKATKGDKLAMGDAVVTRQSMKDDDGRALGTLFTDCTNVGAKAPVFKAKLECLMTYKFSDGEVTAAGVATLSDPNVSFPIVGGSSAYTGASGTVTPGKPGKGDDSVDVLHIS
ncbi:MAG: allene oxide cyclase barrel-like domain-containing protein [Solirubrobacteraceae bacterium]